MRLLWSSTGTLATDSAVGDVLRCRPGSQMYRLIDSLSLGPMSKQRLIRHVLDAKGIAFSDRALWEPRLHVFQSRINKALGFKALLIEDGVFRFNCTIVRNG